MISFRQYLSLPQVERRKLHHWFIFSILHVFSRSLFCNCSSQLWIFLFSFPFFRRFRKMWNFSPLIVVPHSKCFAFPSLFFSLLSIFLPFFFEAVCRDLKKIVISFLSLPWLQARLTLAPATPPTFSSHVFHTNPLRQQRASVRETTSTKKRKKKTSFFFFCDKKGNFFLARFHFLFILIFILFLLFTWWTKFREQLCGGALSATRLELWLECGVAKTNEWMSASFNCSPEPAPASFMNKTTTMKSIRNVSNGMTRRRDSRGWDVGMGGMRLIGNPSD